MDTPEEIKKSTEKIFEVRQANLEKMEDRLTTIRMTDFNDPGYQGTLEDLLIMIVTHLKGEEIV